MLDKIIKSCKYVANNLEYVRWILMITFGVKEEIEI